MTPTLSLGLLQSSAILYLAVFIALTFVLILIPGLMVPGAKAEKITKATTCYLIKTIGMLLVGVSVIQILYGFMTLNLPEFPSLFAVLLVLVIGLGLIVHMSRVIHETVDDASETVPRLVFSHTLEVVGILITVVAGLSMILTFILRQNLDGWEMPATMLLVGILLALSASVHVYNRNRHVAKRAKKR